MLLAVGVSFVVLSYLAVYMAGRTKGLLSFLMALMLSVGATTVFIFQFMLYEANQEDSCTQVGGHYVVDETVREEGGPAFNIYKCVRE